MTPHGIKQRAKSSLQTSAAGCYQIGHAEPTHPSAAILAKNNIRKVEQVAFPELGMEAIWRIEVENFPAFIVVDDKGNDFFAKLT